MLRNKKEKKNKKTHERRLPKFHLLDVVIILLVVATLLGIYFRYNIFDMVGYLQNQKSATVTFSVENIQDATRYYINIGDSVYFKNDGKAFGTIMESSENSDKALSDEPASKSFVDSQTGHEITVNYPEGTRIDFTGRIKCSGTFSDDGTFLLGGSKYICPGQTIEVCTEKVTLVLTVTAIEAAE